MKTTIIVSHHNATEQEIHHFYADASDLCLPPGEFPEELNTVLGNCLPFQRQSVRSVDGDIGCVDYEQANGCLRLTIFND